MNEIIPYRVLAGHKFFERAEVMSPVLIARKLTKV